ncbi:MAG: glycosyltransferase, partial [Candidatus Omnitrophica bacterium]|nr:glycosyltransferase [Candidatus Omnitrophota bacterium]
QKGIYAKGITAYKEIIKKKNVRLIHAQFLTDAIFCYQLIKDARMPVVISLRGYDLFVPPALSFLPKIIPFVSKFIVKSESMKNELISSGCSSEKIEVIYGGINIDKIIFKPRSVDKDNIKILCAGRFVEKKGYDISLKAFSKILKEYPNAQLTLIGEGKQRDHLIKLIGRLGIAANVSMKGYLPHPLFIKELYKHNLFLLPSRTAKDGDKEGIPNVLKEAMASGMPVVSTYHSGIPELITDNETGYLVGENDHRGICDKVHFILNNKEEAFRACLNARFFVEKQFDARKTAGQVESLYDYLLMPDYAQSIIDVMNGKKPKKFRADLHLIQGCNSQCGMCDNWKNDISTSFSRKDVSKVLKDLKSSGVDYVRFHGQEPTLRKDLFSVMKEAKNKGFKVGLKTNALVFSDKKKIEMLNGIIDNLYLSVDSPVEDVHNALRGRKRSFSRNRSLAKGIKQINPHGQVFFNAVVTGFNYRNLAGLLDLAADWNVDRVSFVHLNTKNKKNIGKIKLSKRQFREFYFKIWPQILKKSQEFNIPVDIDPYFCSLLDLPLDLQIRRLVENSEDFEEEIISFSGGLYGKEFYSRNVCYGVFDHVTIDWEGNVFPCCAMPRSPELAIGNLHADNYLKIWNSDQYVKYRESILRGECPFKEQCSRSFERTSALSNYLGKEQRIANTELECLHNQYKGNEYTNNYNLAKIIYYSFSKSKVYREKFKKLTNPNGKLNIPGLSFIKRNELKSVFPRKEIIPNYFEEDYGIFRTSSCGSEAFLYARPLKSNIFDRMSASFIHTGEWSIDRPWLKLTSLNCLESQYPLKEFPASKKRNGCYSNATIIPSSDNFINEPASRIRKIYDLFKNSKATLIHANPTHLKMLLYRFKQEKMPINRHYAVHSTYETLLPSTKKLIKRYLNCEVFNQYGCSEVGPVSFNCRLGNNHIFNDTVYVDVMPAHDLNRPEVGRVVVTHLKNYVMPFIKYFNGDFAYVLKDQECECGLRSPIMGDIVGREDEIIHYKDKVVFPLELDALFCDLENILMYKVFFENGRFFIELVSEHKTKKLSIKKLTDHFKEFFNDANLQIRIKQVECILPKRRGKYTSVVVK